MTNGSIKISKFAERFLNSEKMYRKLILIFLDYLFIYISWIIALTFLKEFNLIINIRSIILFSSGLAFSDYIRANVFLGFPWNLWAYSFSWSIEIIQILNHIGLYAYNLIIVTLFTVPVILFFKISKTKKILILSLLVLFILSLYIHGDYTLNKNEQFLCIL